MYNAMSLARKCIEYFDKPKKELKNDQLGSLKHFRYLYGSLGKELNRENGGALSSTDALKICKVFVKLFFFDAIPGLSFQWDINLEAGNIAISKYCSPYLDQRISNPRNSFESGSTWHIHMHLFRYDVRIWDHEASGRKMSRLGIMLHEILHGFLVQHCCCVCPTTKYKIGKDGHGRAFMMIASKLEEVAP